MVGHRPRSDAALLHGERRVWGPVDDCKDGYGDPSVLVPTGPEGQSVGLLDWHRLKAGA